MSDQPKPTGEWTAQTVFDMMESDYGDDGWKRERAVADAHNAALAAERERYSVLAKEHDRMATEAAAEWEAAEESAEHFRRKIGEVGLAAAKVAQENLQLRQQLAAEREKFDNMVTAISHGLQKQLKRFNTTHPKPDVVKELERMRRELALPEIQQLREQLAAEREKYDTFEKYALQQATEADNAIQECHAALSLKTEQLAAEREKYEVTVQPIGTMGDMRCPRCGTKFEVDNYCEHGHAKPRP